MHRLGSWVAVVAVALLAGCAATTQLDNQVQSFSTLTAVPQPLTYRFDRLPSQNATPAQLTYEAAADPALHKAGFRRDDAHPRYAVQVSGRESQILSPWADPWDVGFGFGFGGRRRHAGVGFMSRWDSVWYQREVGIVVREIATNKVVYETRAVSEGPWRDTSFVLPAMFEASLQGFPNPPVGPRRVDVRVSG